MMPSRGDALLLCLWAIGLGVLGFAMGVNVAHHRTGRLWPLFIAAVVNLALIATTALMPADDL